MRNYTLLLPFLLLLFLLPESVYAQKKMTALKEQDVVYLKDGGILRGKILLLTETSVQIEILGQNIFVHDMDEVIRITMEPAVAFIKEKKVRSGPVTIKNKGYYNVTQLGFHIGGQNNYYGYRLSTVPGVQMINGYQFNRFLAVGLGIGFDVPGQGPVMPAFVEVRGDVVEKQVSPTYFVQAGYNQPLYNNESENRTDYEIKGGLMASGGGGIHIHTRSSISYTLTVGYRYQESSEKYTNTWGGARVSEIIHMKRISWQFGMMF